MYETMEHHQLRACLLENVATGNHRPSDMLHTSKDFAKCLNLLKERSGMYSGRIVQIDLTATSLDDYIDLSSLASYKVFFCLRVSVDVSSFVGTPGVTQRRSFLCCFFLIWVCFGVGVSGRRSFLGFLYAFRHSPTRLFNYGFASCPFSPPSPRFLSEVLLHPHSALFPEPLSQSFSILVGARSVWIFGSLLFSTRAHRHIAYSRETTRRSPG